MDKLEFIKFKHQFIFPYLKFNLSLEEKLQVMRDHELWNVDVNYQQSQYHQELSPHGFNKILIENPEKGMADISWMLEALLGMQSQQIQDLIAQSDLSDEENSELIWKTVNSDALGTPLSYLPSLFRELVLMPGHTVVDLGSGFGNIGHYIGFDHPQCEFIGYEIVRERIMESQRVKETFEFHNCHYFNLNIGLDYSKIHEADIYFIYDSLSPKTRDNVFKKLEKNRARPFKIAVIKGTSDMFDYIHTVDWLEPVKGLEWYDPYRIVGIYQSK